MKRKSALVRLGLGVVLLAVALPARAIPAFARKYGTSCLTCHVVYPKLTPFGEAFRHNGYRFPGVDSDYVKQETVPLGQDANKKTFPESVWPASIPISVPLSIGVNGQAFIHPDTGSSGGRADNGAAFTLNDLVAEGHLWAGAALDDTITLWAELTLHSSADVEHAQVLFNDLIGPKHALNLVVGRGFPTVSTFGPHSSYLADIAIPNLSVATLYGNPAGWQLVDNYNGIELNGVALGGRLDYALGMNAGASNVVFGTEDFYAHAGYKLGGMRLDGEGSTGAADARHPWAETALTLDVFAYHSNTHWAVAPATANDVAWTLGGSARAQRGSLELDAGYYHDRHNHAANGGEVTASVAWGELTYVVFPWMVPGLRVESFWLSPSGGSRVSDLHLMPGVAFLIRPNLKVVLVGNVEHAGGAAADAGGNVLPWAGGSGDWGALVAQPGTVTSSVTEFESIAIFLAWAI